MEKQIDLIHEGDWDYLLILDACRYDYFKSLYQTYFKGKLKKVRSSGSGTKRWLRNTFSGYYDLVYLSANPHIRSWKDENQFKRVLNLWDTHWNEEFDTVLPSRVTQVFVKKAYTSEDRLLVHYIQPHQPFIGLPLETETKYTVDEEKTDEGLRGWFMAKFKYGYMKIKGDAFDGGKFMGIQDKVRKYLGLCPLNPQMAIVRRYGDDVLRWAYRDNLERVLDSISQNLEHIQGKVIISADHGELLGEDGKYGHGVDNPEPLLEIVPWFEMELE